MREVPERKPNSVSLTSLDKEAIMALMKRFDGIAWRQIAAILWRRITSDISTRRALLEPRISWKRPNGTRAPPYPVTPRLNTIAGFLISLGAAGGSSRGRARTCYEAHGDELDH